MSRHSTHRRSAKKLAATVGVVLLASLAWVIAAEFGIKQISVQDGDRVTITYDAQTGAAYTLFHGSSVTNINTPVATNLSGTAGSAQFVQTATANESFYRIQQTGSAPTPLTTITETSPANGDSGVSVNRESIVRFSAALAANAVVTANNFYASYGGRRLLARIELSTDRRTATLFYLEPIPGGTRVYAVFDGTGLVDTLGRPLDADGDGQPGGVASITFDTYSTTPLNGTAVIGRVFASELVPGSDTGTNAVNRPLEGVTITVDGKEQELRTVTDALGNFRLDPAPSGRFFVHIDGRTATNGLANAGLRWDQRTYCPVVGKAWEAVAGKSDNLAGDGDSRIRTGQIFLPLITPGTLQTVSVNTDTAITFPPSVIASNPELAGVTITVPANALFSDNGTRGGSVGIAPVPPDRIPSPLPPGLNFPLVITVQTDGGQNFDRPVPVRFPNLPDPVTGKKLAPGEKSALWSFNHDTGDWEIQGPMTVTADGNFVETDSGVGLRQPGWHGVLPAVLVAGGEFLQFELFSKLIYPAAIKAMFTFYGLVFLYELGDSAVAKITWLGRSLGALSGGDVLTSPNRRPKANYQPPINGCTRVPDLPLGLGGKVSFTEACNQHDIDYGTYAENLFGHKAWADLRLLAGLNSACDKANLASAERTACGEAAFSYYIGVRDFGLYFYKEAQREASEDDLDYSILPSTPTKIAGPALDQGPHYYVILDMYSTDVVRRGKTSAGGLSQDTFVLAPNGLYRQTVVNPRTLEVGTVDFGTDGPGSEVRIPPTFLRTPTGTDTDADGLTDEAELVIGTGSHNPDTDGDGIKDGAEVAQGTDPLDGLAVRTGIIASASTPGTAVDVCALNDMAIVAEGTAGVTVFNVFNGMNPVRIIQVDTPGDAQRVSCSGNLIAVADGSAGLAVIDISNPATARIVHQLNLGGSVQAVAAAGGIAYAGLASGEVIAVDLFSGTVLERASVLGSVQDLALGGDYLYALTDDALHTFSIQDGELRRVSSVNSPTFIYGNRRLFVGSGVAYAVQNKGVNTFSLENPAQPALLKADNTTQFGWKQFVANGSGLGLAAVDPNLGTSGPNDLSLYDVRNPNQPPAFLTTFSTPGVAYAASIYNGLAYIADGAAGLQVINYLAYDSKGQPPTIRLDTSFPLTTATSGVAEEGKLVRLTAVVTDDVQVRNVEFYFDGVKVATDGNFPFEHRFVTPVITATKTNFTVRAKATDTGGNLTWTDEIKVNLVLDATPPRVTRVVPEANNVLAPLETITVFFSEPIDEATLNSNSVRLISAGPDGVLGNADDVAVGGGALSYRNDPVLALLTFGSKLPPSLYQLVVSPPLADLSGNTLAQEFRSQFRIFSTVDTDGDGLPDELEIFLGLNPLKADSRGDGVRDGDRDFDNDGLSNAGEIIMGTDPRNLDTNGNGIKDGDEDTDGDSLSDGKETRLGTNPFAADSDGDGWNDEQEVTAGSDPLNPDATPFMEVIASPSASIVALGVGSESAADGTIANPPVQVILPSIADHDVLTDGLTVAQPPVSLILLSADAKDETVIAQPPVSIVVPPASEPNAPVDGLTIAQPLVSIILQSSGSGGGTVIAQPPASMILVAEESRDSTFIAQPPVSVVLQAVEFLNGMNFGLTLARPPVVVITSPNVLSLNLDPNKTNQTQLLMRKDTK